MFHYVSGGFARIASLKRLILVYYFANVAFAILAVGPYLWLIKKVAGNRLIGQLPSGLENMHFIFDLGAQHGSAFGLSVMFVLVSGVFYLITSSMMQAGAMAVFVGEGPYSPGLFWGGIGRYFWRFIRLFLWSLWVMVLTGIGCVILNLIFKWIGGDDPYQDVAFRNRLIWLVLSGLLVFFYFRVLDYARYHVVANDHFKTYQSVWWAFKAVLRNLGRTMGVALIFWLFGAVLFYAHWRFRAGIAEGGILLLLTGQIYILLRNTVKLGMYSAEFDIYRDLNPEPRQEPVSDSGPESDNYDEPTVSDSEETVPDTESEPEPQDELARPEFEAQNEPPQEERPLS